MRGERREERGERREERGERREERGERREERACVCVCVCACVRACVCLYVYQYMYICPLYTRITDYACAQVYTCLCTCYRMRLFGQNNFNILLTKIDVSILQKSFVSLFMFPARCCPYRRMSDPRRSAYTTPHRERDAS